MARLTDFHRQHLQRIPMCSKSPQVQVAVFGSGNLTSNSDVMLSSSLESITVHVLGLDLPFIVSKLIHCSCVYCVGMLLYWNPHPESPVYTRIAAIQ
jgi:hypothetical protein